ncbi:fatty acid-binding protein, adipocyte-like isoform X2 [Haliotis rufescens]|uniref:fatty acid-binding protein, adipocyte-like isoform X2 n=1 Tax=Haliotis rufescens TaxID=6454 RepID=UPI00201F7AA6|nr:fatty acid-binding protein, adipocyte-like isoform X2 [Haliotis rufescens]
MALEEIKTMFAGKWKLDRSENFDEFLKEMGVNVLLRKMAESSRPEQVIEVKDGQIRISTKTGLSNQDDVFDLGKECEIETNTVKHKVKVVYSDGRMVVTSRPVGSDLKPQRICRELIQDEMVMVSRQ